uniref:N-alpha-acetyltransferase 60 n=1 Tax=Spongospora subterranea TaxID=70186 RepID=A0A0H5QIU4_9EUKA|eukprot:CRZ02015.1 hypothetical protein [Spongospora subterranea]
MMSQEADFLLKSRKAFPTDLVTKSWPDSPTKSLPPSLPLSPIQSSPQLRDIRSLEIRHISSSDLDGLRALDLSLFPVTYSDSFYQLLLDRPELTVLAVSPDQELVGCATSRVIHDRFRSWLSLSPKSVGYISTVGVSVAYRRQGLARILLNRLLEELDKFCDVIILHVKADNESAIRMYLELGFVRVRYLPAHYYFHNTYHDAIQLQRGATTSPPPVDSNVYGALSRCSIL